MMNTPTLEVMIKKLIEEKIKLKEAYYEAIAWKNDCYERVLVWEDFYSLSDENEVIGETLNETYDEYNEAKKAVQEAKNKVETIEEALQALREVN